MHDYIISGAAFLSAVGSVISAFIAHRVKRGADTADQNRRRSEVNRLASRIIEAKRDIDDLSDELTAETNALFAKANAGASSMRELMMEEIAKKKDQATSVSNQAEEIIANLTKGDDRKIDEYMLKLERHHIHIGRLQNWFSRTLLSIQERSNVQRQKFLNAF